MGAPDIEVLLAGRDDGYKLWLREMHGFTEKKANEMVGEFKRIDREQAEMEVRREIRLKESLKKEEQAQKKMRANAQMTARVGFAALAGAVGLFSKSVQKAAERDEDLARSLMQLNDAKDDFFADIGDDLKPFLDGMDKGVRLAGKLRDILVDGVAIEYFGATPGQLNGVDDEEERRKQLQREFRQIIEAQDLLRELTIQGGGPDAQEAIDFKARRAFNRKLAELDLRPQDQTRAREQFDANQAKESAERSAIKAQEKLIASLDGLARAMSDEADLLTARSQGSPQDRELFHRASRAREAAEKQRVITEGAASDQGTPLERLISAAKRNAAIALKADQERSDFDQQLADRQREVDLATRSIGLEREAGELAILRAKGLDEQAKHTQIVLDHSRARLAIDRMALEDEEQRIDLLNQQDRLMAARLAALRKEQTEREAIRKEEFGLQTVQNEIDIQRAKGLDAIADKAQINLDYRIREMEIERMIGVSEEERALRMEQNQRLRDALLGESGRGKSDSVGIGPGLAGGSTLIRQLTGIGHATGDDPVAKNTATMVQQNKELIQAIKDYNHGGAIAG